MDKVHSINSDAPLISVVAPVYKVEPFLQECIDSVLNQSFKDFELILVDDGSPDKCGEICDKAAEKDSRIRVFHQENGGVSSARKLGVDNAKGEWICFVDADDRLPSNALKDLIFACEENGYSIENFDVIEGRHTRFEVNAKTGKEKSLNPSGNIALNEKRGIVIATGFEYAKESVSRDEFFAPQPWQKIIRRSLLIETDALNVLREIFQGEDTIMILKMSIKIHQALRIQKFVYDKRKNIQSVCAVNKDKFFSFSYQTFWWKTIKEIFVDMSDEWQEVYKILVATRFNICFLSSKGKTWHLRSLEFKSYLAIIQEKKNLLTTAAKICLLSTCFPFTLIPEWLFNMTFFGTKFIVMLPIRVIRKLWRIIRRR